MDAVSWPSCWPAAQPTASGIRQPQVQETGDTLTDVPLIVKDVLLQLDDLIGTNGDPVAIGELWTLALGLLGGEQPLSPPILEGERIGERRAGVLP